MHLIRNVLFMLVVLWIPPGLKATEDVTGHPTTTFNTNIEISGIWNTNFQELYLSQTGSSITGFYNSNKGQVTGILDGNILKGWWKGSGKLNCGPEQAWEGPFVFQFLLNEDDNLFIGDWGYCSRSFESIEPSNKTWNGSKNKSNMDAKSLDGSINKSNMDAKSLSVWQTNYQTLYLNQVDSSVTGFYGNNDRQITGILDGNILKGWWKGAGNPSCGQDQAWEGPFVFAFFLDGDKKSFIGDFGKCSETIDNIKPSDKTWNGSLIEGVFNTDIEFSSAWSTNYKELYIRQVGSSIIGYSNYYGNINQEIVTGILKGNLIQGWWKGDGNSHCGPNKTWEGPVAFHIAEDRSSFIGDWGRCSETIDDMKPSDKTWNGTLVGGVFQTGPKKLAPFSKKIYDHTFIQFMAMDFRIYSEEATSEVSQISITTLPNHGTLKLVTTPVALKQEINADDIDQLTYTPYADYSGSDSFSWNGSNNTAYAAQDAQAHLFIYRKIYVSPDESDKLQSVINEAKPYDYIVLKAGVHKIAPSDSDTMLTIANKSHLTLAVEENAKIQTASGYGSVFLIQDSDNITLKNLDISSKVDGQDCCSRPMIILFQAKHVNIIDSVLAASGLYAVGMANVEDVNITGGKAIKNTQGVFRIQNAKKVTITDMLITENESRDKEGGIFEIHRSKDISLVGNVVKNNKTAYFKQIVDTTNIEEYNVLSHNTFSQTGFNISPMLRVETGMHTAVISRIDVDADERYLVTASNDKTVRVWGLEKGQLLRVLRPPIGEGDEGMIYAVAISPDGKTVAAGGWTGFEWDNSNSIYLFDRATGELRQRLTGHEDTIFHLAYSPDGRYLVASLGGGFHVYRTTDYRLQAKDTSYDKQSYWAEFDNQGRLVTSCDDGYIRLYDSDFKLLTQHKTPGGNSPFAVRFSPEGDKIAVAFDDSTQVNVLSGKDLRLLYSPNTQSVNYGSLAIVAWSQDGRWLYAGGAYNIDGFNLILRWSEEGRGSYESWSASFNTIQDIRALRDGEIVFATFDPTFGQFNAYGEKTLFREADIGDFRRGDKSSVLFSSEEGDTVQFGYEVGGKRPARFSLNERTLSLDFLLFFFDKESLSLTAPRTDAPGLNITGWGDTTRSELNGNALSLYQGEMARSLAIANDGEHFLLGADWSLRLFDKQGKQQWKQSVPSTVWGVNIAGNDNDKVGIAAFGDGTIRWYRLTDGEKLLAFFPHKDGKRWVLWTPQGYYMASPGGESLVGWHINRGAEQAADFYPVAQFREQFYRPDVISKVLETLEVEEALLLAEIPKVKQGIEKSLGSSNYRSDVVAKIVDGLNLEKAMRSVRDDLGKQQQEVQGRIQKLLPPIVAMLALVDECASSADSNADSRGVNDLASLGEKCRPKADENSLGLNDLASRGVSDLASRGVSDLASRGDGIYFSTPEVELRYRLRRPSGQPITTLKVLVDGRPLGTIRTKGKGKICDSLPQSSSRGVSDLTSRTIGQNDCQLAQDEQEHRLRVLLPPRDVEVSLIAENQLSVSEAFTIRLNWTGEKSEVVKPTLYVLAVGVSNYDDNELTLNYAAKDATDFVKTLEAQQDQGLYHEVKVKLLADATKEEVIAGFNWLKERVTANDVAMLFLAGHGFNSSDRRYYFLPRDVDRQHIAQSSVVYHDIKNTVTALPGKTLFFIDTCHSGNVMGSGFVDVDRVSNDLSSSENGVVVIAAATGKQLAWENKKWGNGAFTKVLLEGLVGNADISFKKDRSPDRKISFKELDLYLSQGVSELTGGKQTPTVAIPKTIADFAVISLP